jgi:hypothetical protein
MPQPSEMSVEEKATPGALPGASTAVSTGNSRGGLPFARLFGPEIANLPPVLLDGKVLPGEGQPVAIRLRKRDPWQAGKVVGVNMGGVWVVSCEGEDAEQEIFLRAEDEDRDREKPGLWRWPLGEELPEGVRYCTQGNCRRFLAGEAICQEHEQPVPLPGDWIMVKQSVAEGAEIWRPGKVSESDWSHDVLKGVCAVDGVEFVVMGSEEGGTWRRPNEDERRHIADTYERAAGPGEVVTGTPKRKRGRPRKAAAMAETHAELPRAPLAPGIPSIGDVVEFRRVGAAGESWHAAHVRDAQGGQFVINVGDGVCHEVALGLTDEGVSWRRQSEGDPRATVCPVDGNPCEGQGTDDDCNLCEFNREKLARTFGKNGNRELVAMPEESEQPNDRQPAAPIVRGSDVGELEPLRRALEVAWFQLSDDPDLDPKTVAVCRRLRDMERGL